MYSTTNKKFLDIATSLAFHTKLNMSQESSTGTSINESQVYQILQNNEVGRYMIASKRLQQGEEILTEMPFVVGPKTLTPPICLSCYKPWGLEEDKPLCSKCKWPICGQQCEDLPQHKDYECQVFADAKETFNLNVLNEKKDKSAVPQLQCVTPLRLLLESERNIEGWQKKIIDMESHNKKRCQKPQWKVDEVNVVDYLRKRLNCDRFSAKFIQTICGILDVNSFEIRTAKGYYGQGLYPTVALLNHSCIANTSHSISPIDYRIILRTTVEVSANDELYVNYACSLLPTMLRRKSIFESKYFMCTCRRCSDPTELGTHMSSVKCKICPNSFVLPLDSLDENSEWKCKSCGFLIDAQSIEELLEKQKKQVDTVDNITEKEEVDCIYERENIVKSCQLHLHPRHSFLTMLRHSLILMYGNVEEYLLDDLSSILLEHKIEMCRLLLKVLNVVEPGLTRIRGRTLYELHSSIIKLAKIQYTAGIITKSELKLKKIEARDILEEAVTILTLEPERTTEREKGIEAKTALIKLEESIKSKKC